VGTLIGIWRWRYKIVVFTNESRIL
jgi:hypothetical protein